MTLFLCMDNLNSGIGYCFLLKCLLKHVDMLRIWIIQKVLRLVMQEGGVAHAKRLYAMKCNIFFD